jgi:hypothetical protein
MVMLAASTALREFAYLLSTRVLTSSTNSPGFTGTEVAVEPGSQTHSLRCGLEAIGFRYPGGDCFFPRIDRQRRFLSDGGGV